MVTTARPTDCPVTRDGQPCARYAHDDGGHLFPKDDRIVLLTDDGYELAAEWAS